VGLLLYLAQPGQRGNEAFLGIGIIGWVIIVVLAAFALYFFMRSRRRGVLDRIMGRRRRDHTASIEIAPGLGFRLPR
jgi:hypothetical protein